MKSLKKLYAAFKYLEYILALIFHKASNILSKIAYLIIFRPKYGNFFFKDVNLNNILVKSLSYREFKLKVLINSFWDNWRIKDYETWPLEEILNDLEQDRRSDIIYYEIGANIGYSALVASKILHKRGIVYAIEPEPTNYKTLCDNILLNKATNIVALNFGVSNANKVEKLYYNIYHTKMKYSLPVSGMGAHSMVYDNRLHNKETYSNVIFLKFSKLIEDFALMDPSHIFIDALGAELIILETFGDVFKKKSLKKIMVDIEEKSQDIESTKVFKFMKKKKFKLLRSNFYEGTKNLPNTFRAVFYRS